MTTKFISAAMLSIGVVFTAPVSPSLAQTKEVAIVKVDPSMI